jgi:hypothetical protein
MTLGELLALARLRLDDRAAPYLWSDLELTEFANTAQDEAAERARFLRSTVPVSVVEGTAVYTLSTMPLYDGILDMRFTDSLGRLSIVRHASYADFNVLTHYGDAVGVPYWFEYGASPAEIRLYPTPNLDGDLAVDITRLPAEDERMVSSGDEPIIPTDFHRDLVYWMLFEAYSLRDGDIRESTSADKAEAQFTRKFGPKISAKHKKASRFSGVGQAMYPRRYGG